MSTRRPAVAIFAAALAIRFAVALWAPGEPEADGIFYRIYADHIARGWGYSEIDGSPAIRWMPGWPLVLAGLQSLFGRGALVVLGANSVFDATTAALLVGLGARLFGPRVGLLAGGLYAAWPGMIFLCASYMSEPLFNLLLVGSLTLVARACDAERGRSWLVAAAGLCLGGAALVKAEPLAALPGIAWALWRSRGSGFEFARNALVVAVAVAAMLTPWTLRNLLEFDRFLPTAASGGEAIHLANHPGATGGQDFRTNRLLHERYRGANSAATSIARHDAGFREAWNFVRTEPIEALRIAANKLRLTYTDDARGAMLLRGLGPPERWHVSPATWQWLQGISNAWWFSMLALAIGGASALRGAHPTAVPLLIGATLVPWLCLHLVFLGGPRYHAPEVPVLALLAACGIEALRASSVAAKDLRLRA